MLTKLTHRAIVVFTLISSVMAQGGGYALDFAGNDGCSAASCSNFVEVSWSTNMSTYTVSVWVKSNSENPAVWRSYFNSYNQSSDGIQLDCDGSGNYRFLSNAGSDIFGSVVTTWTHIAVSANGSNTYLYYNGSLVTTNSWVENTWNQIELGRNRNEDRPGNYQIDEVRVWNASLTQSQIQAWMHKPIDTNHGNYSNSTSDNLKAYYQMSNGSGTSLTDNSANSNTGTLTNMDNNDWVTSNAPISTLTSDYTTDAEALWSGSGTSASDASNGLNMTVSSTLSEANFAVFGNNNTAGTSTSDLPSGVEVRSARIWYVDESNTVAADVTIDISDATGYTVTAGTASDYKLLNRAGTSGDFSILASGSSKSGDAVTFSSVSLSDEYLAIGQATDSDAYLSPHVTISGDDGFRMMSSPIAGTVYDDILGDLWIQGMTNGDTESGTANVWTYDASTPEWSALTNLNTASLTAGQGFLVYVFADTDNDGDDDLSVTLSVAGTENSATVTRSTTASEWNLLGNPFASTIDADQLFTDNSNYTAVVYVYDDANSRYNTWNGSSGDLSSGLIAPYQGFWIQSGSSGTSFAFTSDCKSASAGTFYKTMADNTGSMSFTITSGEYSNKTFVSFMNSGEEGLDNADAYKLLPMSPSERIVGISYAEGNGLDISNLPYSHDGSISIPLDVMYLTVDDDYNFVTNENDVTMIWDVSSLPGHVSLTLTDNVTGTAVNLTEESEITFSTEAKGSFLSYGTGGVNIYPQVGESRFTLTVAYSALTSNDEPANLPGSFALHPAYPNPFNPSTTISFDIPDATDRNTSLHIYDITGKLVETLVNKVLPSGSHAVTWDPKNLSSGLYIVQLKVGNKTFNQKLTFLK